MIITCPNCQTSYQLAERAIGSAGRKVSCAQCQESWHATPEPEPAKVRPKPKLVTEEKTQETPEDQPIPEDKDKLFDAEGEAALDAEFEQAENESQGGDTEKQPKPVAEEPEKVAQSVADKSKADESEAEAEGTSAEAEKADVYDTTKIGTGLKGKRRQAMQKRQVALRKKLPMGRIRSNARFALLVLFVWLLGGGLFFRTDIVRVAPDMAGFYAAIGLPVNVIGLEFENVETLRTMQNGVDVTLVTGHVRNIGGGQVQVPPIVVSILDGEGASLYSWSVTPLSRVLGPHEKLEFEARLNSAPENAANVKLAFAEDRAK